MTYDDKALEAAAKAVEDVNDKGLVEMFDSHVMRIVKAALTAYHAHESAQREEAGMVGVPREPAEAMLEAALSICSKCPTTDIACQDCSAVNELTNQYKAMLQATQGAKGDA